MSRHMPPTASAVASAMIVALMSGTSLAEEASAPHGSAIAVTTALTAAGQDFKQTLVYNFKSYWDEIFDYAIEQDEAGNLIPGYAESWATSDDHLTWTFVIREGVKFHNGDVLTAEDVAWSWNRLIFDADSKHTLTGYAPVVESIKADGNKVLIKTKEPQSLLPLWFAKIEANMAGTALSKKYYEKVGAEEAARNPVGTGAYKFVSSNGEQSATLTAFDDPERSEWQKSRTAGFKDLTIMAVPEASTRLALLKTGGADIVPLSFSAVEEVKSQPGLRVLTVPATNFSGIWCLGFTLNDASPCNDQKVREALSISIDRATIAEALYQGQAEPSVGWYGGPGSFGYPTEASPIPFDPERAQKLLEEAGFGSSNPLKIELVTYNDDVDFPMLPTLAEAIVGYYQAIGIDASIRIMDWDAQKDILVKGEFPGQRNNSAVTPVTLFMRGMDNRFYFPAEQIGAYTASGRIGASLWDNTKLPEQQERLDAIAGTFDLPTQEKLFADYTKWMSDNYNHIPLLASATVFGVSSKIADWRPVAGKPFVQEHRTLTPAD